MSETRVTHGEEGPQAGSSAHIYEHPQHRERIYKVAKTSEFSAILQKEAQLLLWLERAGLPKLLEVGVWPPPNLPNPPFSASRGLPYLCVSRVAGSSLRSLFATGRGLAPGLVYAAAKGLAGQLAYLAALGISHGDLKPAHVYWDDAQRQWGLIDFGLAGPVASVPAGGTLRYFDQANPKAPRFAHDRLALGLMLAEMLEPAQRAARPSFQRARQVLAAHGQLGVLAPLLAADWRLRPDPARLLGVPQNGPTAGALVWSTYVRSRRHELGSRAESARFERGVPAALRLKHQLAHGCGLASGGAMDGDFQNLSPEGRKRWLSLLVGAVVGAWPADLWQEGLDEQWLAALETRAKTKGIGGLTWHDLPGRSSPKTFDPEPGDWAGWCLALQRPGLAPHFVSRAQENLENHHWPPGAEAFVLDGWRRLGEHRQVLAKWAGQENPQVQIIAARCARRLGSESALQQVYGKAQGHQARSWVAGLLARLKLDRGDGAAAEKLLGEAQGTPFAGETAALLAAFAGDLEEASRLAQALWTSAPSPELRARANGLLGYLHHAAGRKEAALKAYSEAAHFAAQAGVVEDEATYCSGQAAAAADCGYVSLALEASRRAQPLWLALQQAGKSGRAALAEAAALVSAGAMAQAHEALLRAQGWFAESDDGRGSFYAALVAYDLALEGYEGADPPALAPTSLSGGDQLRLLARQLLLPGEANTETLATGSSLASQLADDEAVAQWVLALGKANLARGEAPLPTLVRQATKWASVAPRWDQRAQLAWLLWKWAPSGQRAEALHRAQELADHGLRHCPPEYASNMTRRPWIGELYAGAPPPHTGPDAQAQAGAHRRRWGDALSLVRSLAAGGRLAALLTNMVDALVLGTGAERGVLLMPAPGGKLVPRAARNWPLKPPRARLKGVSLSLARQALEENRTLLTVDALAEHGHQFASVHAHQLRSVLVAPLRARGQVLGVAYLDEPHQRGVFQTDAIAWVELLGEVAALALLHEKQRLSLRRNAARQTRRAQRLDAEVAAKSAEIQRLADGKISAGFPHIIGRSENLMRTLAIAKKVAQSDMPVLIFGESGSGKELVAAAIHEHSEREKRVFVSENCGAIPDTLLESTLFGHAKGAFTGATKARRGLFEIADGGTLFLDEVGEMSLGMQTKLLRVLQNGELRPVGSEQARKVDVRVVAATHQDLNKLVSEGRFRQDLYYRLCVVEVKVPPLRSRLDDLPLLAEHFLRKYAGNADLLSQINWDQWRRHHWPGNVRELENEIRRLVVLGPQQLANSIAGDNHPESPVPELDGRVLKARVEELEKHLIVAAMKQNGGNQSRAAEILGLSRYGLQKKLKRYDLLHTKQGRGQNPPLVRP